LQKLPNANDVQSWSHTKGWGVVQAQTIYLSPWDLDATCMESSNAPPCIPAKNLQVTKAGGGTTARVLQRFSGCLSEWKVLSAESTYLS